MAKKKNTKKEKKFVAKNPYAFFTKGRSKKAIQMDYSLQAKPPSSKEKRVNRVDYPDEDFYYLKYFKKHNMAPPKKQKNFYWFSATTATKPATAKKTTAKKTTAKKSSATKTTKKKTTSKKK